MLKAKNKLIFLIFICFWSLLVSAQEVPLDNTHKKIDEFGIMPCGSLLARWDNIEFQLRANPSSQLYLIGYTSPKSSIDELPHLLRAAKEYLTENRRLDNNRIVVFDGGYQNHLKVEAWIVPAGADPPQLSPSIQANNNLSSAQKFAEASFPLSLKGEKGCFLVFCAVCECSLESVDLKEYAKHLKSNSKLKGYVFLSLDASEPVSKCTSFRTSVKLIKSELTQVHGVEAKQLVFVNRGKMKVPKVELWVAPRGSSTVKSKPKHLRKKHKQRRK